MGAIMLLFQHFMYDKLKRERERERKITSGSLTKHAVALLRYKCVRCIIKIIIAMHSWLKIPNCLDELVAARITADNDVLSIL